MWMEHSLASNLQSDLSAWFGANPAVPAACTDGRGMQTKEGCTTIGFDNFSKVRFWTTPTTTNALPKAKKCVPYYRWVSDYIGVIGGRSKPDAAVQFRGKDGLARRTLIRVCLSYWLTKDDSLRQIACSPTTGAVRRAPDHTSNAG